MEVERRDSSEQSASPVPQYADYRKYSEEGSIGYEENEYRIEGKIYRQFENKQIIKGDVESGTESDSSVDSARYNGTAYSQKFGRQVSLNHFENYHQFQRYSTLITKNFSPRHQTPSPSSQVSQTKANLTSSPPLLRLRTSLVIQLKTKLKGETIMKFETVSRLYS